MYFPHVERLGTWVFWGCIRSENLDFGNGIVSRL